MGIGLLRYRQVTGAGPMQPFGLCCPVVPQNPAAVLASSSSAAVQHWRQQQPGPAGRCCFTAWPLNFGSRLSSLCGVAVLKHYT